MPGGTCSALINDILDLSKIEAGRMELHLETFPLVPVIEDVAAEKQRVRQQMLARNWHDDAISSELGSFCQKSHLIAGLIDLS